MERRVNRRRTVVVVLATMAVVITQLTVPRLAPPAVAAPGDPGSITLQVMSARSVNPAAPLAAGFAPAGTAIPDYKWLINADVGGNPGTALNQGTQACLPASAGVGVGSTDPNYADTCQWPSVRKTSGQVAIIAQGDQSTLSSSIPLAGLAPGKYLISVTADGFKIDGQHFTVVTGQVTPVTVQMNPTPLPLTTLRIQVFNDNTPVDATYEVGAEDGLAGFTAHLYDVFGDVSVDYYGNAICTKYKLTAAGAIVFVGGKPVVDTAVSTGVCTSDSTGEIVIPNMGPNRFAARITPPVTAGQTYQWVQTTTLEGGHDHDIWSQEGATGFDTEQSKGAELVPSVQFGFVKTQALASTVPTGGVKGVVVAGLNFIGGTGGQPGPPEPGLAGAKIEGPIKAPWIALSDLGAGDTSVYVGRGANDGSFNIQHVPDGTYQLTMWDDDQDYILFSVNVEVSGGLVTDVGNEMLVGWFTHIRGTVFMDDNGNGKRDGTESGVPSFPLTVRERDNSMMDQAMNSVVTGTGGDYDIPETYPLGKWLILEAFQTGFQTTGITYQGQNETTATTKLGSLVDLSFLPIIGLGARIDWGVQRYAPGTNGGIVGTVSYDTTRNELDPAQAATEGYSPGIPNVLVRLYASVPCDAATAADSNLCLKGKKIVPLNIPDPADPTAPMITNPAADRGALVKGPELNQTTSETYQPPRGCTARDYKGTPLTDQQALPAFGGNWSADPALDTRRLCVESPMMGVAVGPSDDTPGNAGQTVNGNYGFGTSTLNLWPPSDTVHNPGGLALYAPLPAGVEQDLRAEDYIVSVDIPANPVGGGPMYKATREEDVNVFDGDTYLPQQNYPPATQAAADTAAPAGATPADPANQPPSQTGGIVSPCAGALHKVAVTNQAFIDGGGSPFQGQDRPSCADKLVTVRDTQATAPNFNLFTDVPLPTYFWGLTLNDLGLTLDKRSVNYGEAQGLPFVPVGLYDSFGRLSYTTHTDFNGFYEALVPSTGTFNCPVPAGPCPNMYRFVGNDPGQPGAENPDYNSRFRTIATNFQGWPGLYTVTDEAPTQVAATVLTPDTTVANPTMCDLGAAAPQVFAVDKPVVRGGTTPLRTVTVNGIGFGATPGVLRLNGGNGRPIISWSDTKVVFSMPNGLSGPVALNITASNGLSTYNALTIQVLEDGLVTPGTTPTSPMIVEVGGTAPGHYATIQAALEAAKPTAAKPYWLVVVRPNAQTAATPLGEYTENVIVHHGVRIQGVGPGGFQGATYVPGSIIDGAGFNPDSASGTAWITLLSGLTYSGDPQVPDAAVVTVLDDPARSTLTTYPTTIDGFTITGGAQSNFAGNVNAITGGVKTPYGATGALITQGGGIYVHNNVRGVRLTDNVIRGNGGSYGGGVRVGTPYVPNNRNNNLVLEHNQIRDNGGTNLAGGVGLFNGSNNYHVNWNAICGNHSAEYGGAVSAFGYNAFGGAGGGEITHNRIWFNASYDEGGGVMIAGELPADPTQLSEGSGPVTIDANVIQANLANDDGGGVRLLQTSGSHIRRTNPETISITNNTIANNVSAHEGGGIALDDAVFVNIVNNTVAKNITTATAVTSNGSAAPAGLSTGTNSDPLQARLANTTLFPGSATLASTTFSKPTLMNDVFWDNRAGSFSGGLVTGIGSAGATDVDSWDMGAVGAPGALLSPINSVIQTSVGTDGGTATTVGVDPLFLSPYDVSVDIQNLRTNPAFRQAVIVTQTLTPSLMGNYHLAGIASSAYGRGTGSVQVRWGAGPSGWVYLVAAPNRDIDGDVRPSVSVVGTTTTRRYDAGSDQVQP